MTTKVLVVDDDPTIVLILKAFFANYKIQQVIAAGNGAEAIELLKDHGDIDLIVSDLNMPTSDGVEFLMHLQEIGCQIPIVIVSSAHSSIIAGASTLASAYKLNLLGTMSKPLKFDEFAALLKLSN